MPTPRGEGAAGHLGVEVEAPRLGVDLQEVPAPRGGLRQPGEIEWARGRAGPACAGGMADDVNEGLAAAASTRAV